MTWTINGVDPSLPSTYGLAVSRVQGWLDDVQEQLPTINVPGVPGLVALSTTPTVAPRRLVAPGVIIGSGATLAIRAADARTKLDKLRAALAKPSLTIVLADQPTRSLTGDAELTVVEPVAASMIADKLPVTITIMCRDPYYYDITATTATGVVSFVAALGTAQTRPTINLTAGGAIASLVLRVTNAADTVTYGTITVGPFILGDIIVVDFAARTVTVNSVARPDLIIAGDFWALDVTTQGDYNASTWPTIRAGAAVSISYKKAWR